MKLKKLIFLPLMLVALASCNLGGGPGTSGSKPGTSAGTSQEVLTLEEANSRVAAAIDKLTDEELKSLALSLDVEFSMEQALLDVEGVKEYSEVLSVDATADIKAKDLDKETAQMAAAASGTILMKEDGDRVGEISGDVAFYYVDEFVYVKADATLFDVSQPEELVLDTKQKMEVGPFPGLDLGEELPEEIEDIGEIDFEEFDELMALLGGNVTAVHSGDAVAITYTFRQDDLFDVFVQMVVGDETLSAEELADMRTLFNDMFTLRKASVTISINAAGYISGLDVELDVDFKIPLYDWDDTIQDEVLDGYSLISIDGEVSLELAINEPVTITFPSFADYELVDEIVLIEN